MCVSSILAKDLSHTHRVASSRSKGSGATAESPKSRARHCHNAVLVSLCGNAEAKTGERIMDLRTITRPLYEAKTWIKFLGGALVGIGVFYALTIVGLIIAWLFLWLGALLWQAGSQIDRAFSQDDELLLAGAFQKLQRFFVVGGGAMLIYLIVVAVMLVIGGVLALLGVLFV